MQHKFLVIVLLLLGAFGADFSVSAQDEVVLIKGYTAPDISTAPHWVSHYDIVSVWQVSQIWTVITTNTDTLWVTPNDLVNYQTALAEQQPTPGFTATPEGEGAQNGDGGNATTCDTTGDFQRNYSGGETVTNPFASVLLLDNKLSGQSNGAAVLVEPGASYTIPQNIVVSSGYTLSNQQIEGCEIEWRNAFTPVPHPSIQFVYVE